MIKIDLPIKKNDKVLSKLSMERNPFNNKFYLLGTNIFKLYELSNDNKIIELKVGFQRTIKQATWGKFQKNILYIYDSMNILYFKNVAQNNIHKFENIKNFGM